MTKIQILNLKNCNLLGAWCFGFGAFGNYNQIAKCFIYFSASCLFLTLPDNCSSRSKLIISPTLGPGFNLAIS